MELRSIDPPPSIQASMEKQMKADREKRAMILTAEGTRESAIKQAEGQKQAQILEAEGAKQAAILAAEADRQSRMLRAQGERAAAYLQAQGQAKAIEKTFAAIKAGRPTPELLAYQYLQVLPQLGQGDANKVWVIPSDFGSALQGFTKLLGAPAMTACTAINPRRLRKSCPSPKTTATRSPTGSRRRRIRRSCRRWPRPRPMRVSRWRAGRHDARVEPVDVARAS
ncbi:hypothetical protein I553_9956 [Mycobacterium xenopi 4042]|uniref:SPFH domain / Band 7 family protein n=1 Tax=Mycobacterium xenopi 4042 TaxID=1299334 RepID=X7YP70_MYCXE|nr:hypothetical protein I553_9956 [Mycobacterium xenopi 4042]